MLPTNYHRTLTSDDLNFAQQLDEVSKHWTPDYKRMLARLGDYGEAIWKQAEKQNANALSRVIAFVDIAQGMFATSLEARKVSVACTSGCSLCCYLQVEVLQYEADGIVQWLVHEERQAELLPLLIAAYARIESDDLTCAEYRRKDIPCLFLVDERCSVYNARPLTCVQYHSSDLAACQRASWDEA